MMTTMNACSIPNRERERANTNTTRMRTPLEKTITREGWAREELDWDGDGDEEGPGAFK
jgi:hypothetical protein